ncbi:uncharacterized protein LOC144622816 [Crassostrea virginica]
MKRLHQCKGMVLGERLSSTVVLRNVSPLRWFIGTSLLFKTKFESSHTLSPAVKSIDPWKSSGYHARSVQQQITKWRNPWVNLSNISNPRLPQTQTCVRIRECINKVI